MKKKRNASHAESRIMDREGTIIEVLATSAIPPNGGEERQSGDPQHVAEARSLFPKLSRKTALLRALRLKCPNCGKAKLLHSYLKPIEFCPTCGERYGHIRSDDAAPWLTILVVGHILVPILVAVESSDIWPQTFSMAFWPIAAVVLAGLVLPRAKGFMIGMIWFEKSPGSEIG